MKYKSLRAFIWVVLLTLVLAGSRRAAAQNLVFYTSPSYSVSSSGVWGQNITVKYSIYNPTGSNAGAFSVAFYLSTSSALNAPGSSNVSFGSLPYSNGLPRLSFYSSQQVTIPLPNYIPSGFSDGQNYLITVISQGGAAASGSVQIISPPTSVQFYTNPALGLTGSSAVQWGQSTSVGYQFSAANSGAAANVVANAYLSTTTSATGATSIANFGSVNIPMGTVETYSGSFSPPIQIPPAFPSAGTIYLVVTLSINGQVVATNSVPMTVSTPAADLVGYNGSITSQGKSYAVGFGVQQSSATWGQVLGLQYAIHNQAAGAAGPFIANLYLSESPNFGSSNAPGSSGLYYLGQISFDSGLGGGISTVSTDGQNQPGYSNVIQLPGANPFGDSVTHFYIGMVINPTGVSGHPPITESNLANNCNQGAGIDFVAVTVTPPQPQIVATGSNPAGSTSSLQFGNVNLGVASTQTVTITDTGLASLNLTGATVTGPFALTGVVSSIQNLSAPYFPSLVTANSTENRVLSITYTPTAAGQQTGTLTVASNDPAQPAVTFALQGTGIAQPHLVLANPVPLNGDNFSADYGGVAVNTLSAKTFVLSNTGTAPLVISQNGLALTSTQGGVWSIASITSSTQGAINLSAASKNIAAGGAETWSVVVNFLPTALGGNATGLQIFSNDPATPSTAGAPTATCALQGQGLTPMTLTIASAVNGVNDANPLVMDFGSVHATGQQAVPGTITLTNTGQLPLVIPQNGLTLASRTNFAITGITSSTQGAVSLAAGTASIAASGAETWTIAVRFQPTGVGNDNTTLAIASNDPAHASQVIALNGAGLNQPGLVVTTPNGDQTLPFGPILNDGAGQHVGRQSFTLTNRGLLPLVVSQNGLALLNAAGFSIQSVTSSTQGAINLASGTASIAAAGAETWTVSIGLDPTANAAYTGTLTMATNDPVTPSAALALSGSGVTPSLTLNPTASGSAVLTIQAGAVYTISWTATDSADTAGSATLTLSTSAANTLPAAGLTTIATIPFSASTTSYAWVPDASLVGQTVYIYGNLQDQGVSVGSYSAQKLAIEASGSFTLLSPLITASNAYAYTYIYNGKNYGGIANLQPGSNVINITTPLPGGGSVVHQITVNDVPSLLASQGYTYDEMNRPKTYTNGNGITTTYTYSLAGNLVKTSASNGNTVSYTYDNLNRRTSMVDSTGTTFYGYDDLDRLTSVTTSASGNSSDPANLVLQYQYDSASRLTDMIYPGGEHITYSWDNANRMLTANDVTTGQNTSYTYKAATGQLQTVTRANGVVTTYQYDGAGRLIDIKHVNATGHTLAEYAYTLDTNGNATALLTTFDDGSQKQEIYTYDSLQRLIQVTYGAAAVARPNVDKTVAYTYDNNGNRLSRTTTLASLTIEQLTYSYGSDNRLVQISDLGGKPVASYTYDRAGNRVQMSTPEGSTYYTYDEHNLLSQILSPSDYIVYTYDGRGNRVSKTLNGNATFYVNDPTRAFVQNLQERIAGVITRDHIYGLDRLETHVNGGLDQLFLQDRVGSVVAITDPSANLVTKVAYDAFGISVSSAAEFGFSGEEQDRYFVFLRLRYYDPSIGSFISKDPDGISAGLNGYVYTHANPVNSLDPSGADTLSLLDAEEKDAAEHTTYNTAKDISQTVGTKVGSKVGSRWGAVWGARGGLLLTEFLTGEAIDPLGGGLIVIIAGALIGNEAGSATGAAAGNQVAGTVVDLSYGKSTSLGDNLVSDGYAAAGELTHNPLAKDMLSLSQSITTKASDLTKESESSFDGVAGSTASKGIFGDDFGDLNLNLKFDLPDSLNVGGVLINQAATLVGSNLSSIKGATFDPVTKQIVFLGAQGAPNSALTAVDMDYFYTAIQAVYGSATPPYVTLNPPAAPASQWPKSQTFTNGSTQGFLLLYNPLWSGEDTTVAVRFRLTDQSGTLYDFTYNFNCFPYNGTGGHLSINNGGRYLMGLLYSSTTGTPPIGLTLNTAPFLGGSPQSSTLSATSQTSYFPVQLTNQTGGNLVVSDVIVIPGRQHRQYGGRVDGTKLGWVLYEADRVMKCLSVGKDNLTGATYSSTSGNVPVLGYKNLIEQSQALGSGGGFNRLWFEPNDMTLQRYVDPVSGQATIGFQSSSVHLLTEAYLQGLAADPAAAAFATFFTNNYDAFAKLSFPVEDPVNPSTIDNVPIFAMLQQVMQAVCLARFFHDNNIPLDQWWMSSYQPPVANTVKSIPTAYNEAPAGGPWYLIYGGVRIHKPNSYLPSAAAQSLGSSVLSARPAAATGSAMDVPSQLWNVNGTSQGNLTAVSASLAHDHQDGNVKLSARDLSFASAGEMPLEFTRYYQSSWTGSADLGPGWRHGRYALQFSDPSLYDQYHLVLDAKGKPLATAANGDTFLHPGTVRFVDLATGRFLDFISSMTITHGLDAQGNAIATVTGLDANDIPTFTPGSHKSGATLVQTGNYVLGYTVSMPDGSKVYFDPYPRLDSIQDRHGHYKTFQYNTASQLTTIVDDANQKLNLTYDATSGLLTGVTGLNSEGVNYQYDTGGRLSAVVHSLTSTVLYQYTYNSQNQLATVTKMDGTTPVTTAPDVKGRSGSRMNTLGNTTSLIYSPKRADGSRTTTATLLNSGLASSQKNTDVMGRTTSTTDMLGNTQLYGYNGNSLLPNSVQLPTPNRPAIQIARNAYGQPTTVTDPAVPGAQPSQIAYDPTTSLPTQVTDGAGRPTAYAYTATKNLQRYRRQHNGANVDVNFGYDTKDHLKTVTDPMGHMWTINKDSVGRTTSVVDPTGVTVSSTYDQYGNVATVTDPRLSSAIVLQHDLLHRLTSVTTPMGTTTYAYDPVTKWLASKTQKDTQGNTLQSVSYTYNNATGQVTAVTSNLTPAGGGASTPVTTAYGYDAFGNVQTVTPPGAQPINFSYNAAGQLLGTTETNAGPAVGPTILASAASNGAWSNQRNQTMSWGAPQSSLPITGYSYAQDGIAGSTANASGTSLAWNAVSEGKHTFTMKAVDAANLWSPLATFNLWVDATAPVMSVPALALTSPSTVAETLSVSDALSGLGSQAPQLSWTISADATRNWGPATDMSATTGAQWTGSVSADWAQCAGQSLYLRVQAQDVAGNLATNTTAAGVVLVQANPTTAGAPTGGGIFTNGASATIHPGANAGFVFTNWSVGGSSVSTAANYTFTVGGIQSLVANFAPSTLPAWKSTMFTPAQLSDNNISGDAARPAGDGVSNLTKYALGMDPNTSSASGLPTFSTVTVGGISYMAMTYTKNKLTTDVSLHPEWSSNMSDWSTSSVTENILSDGPVIQQVQDLVPLSVAPKVFMHLRIAQP